MKNPEHFLINDTCINELQTDCAVWPFLAYYIDRIKSIQSPPKISPHEKNIIINGFLKNLASRITNASKNVLSTERQVLQETLSPIKISTEEHHEILRKDNRYLLNILQAYPELSRLLRQLCDNFIIQTENFFHHLNEDRPCLSNILPIDLNNKIIECNLAESETHNGSCTVCVLVFDNQCTIVYKPRDLKLEAAASNLLKRLANHSDTLYHNWNIPLYLVKSDHGWVQHAEQDSVANSNEASEYYSKIGFLLGFCTALTATDITSDNLIAQGVSPIPIDLETAFYSVLTTNSIPKEIRWNSVQTSILPTWTWKGSDGIGVDLSGLGGLQEQYVSLNLYQHLQDRDGNSDFGTDGVKILPGKNVLYLNGTALNPWEFSNEIVTGFEHFFDTLKSHENYVIQEISDFSGLNCRYVPRPTATYHYAIQCSLHPTLMRSTKSRKDFLTKILDNDTAPAVDFLSAEVDACLNLDIPYAKSKVGELEFIEPTYNGTGHLDTELYINGLDHSVEYIKTFSPNRCRFEVAQIKNSLIAMQQMYQNGRKLTDHVFRANDNLEDLKKIDLADVHASIEAAKISNTHFLINALSDEVSSKGFWYGFHASPAGTIEYSELGEDFYYGISGIAYGCILASKWTPIPIELVQAITDVTYNRTITKLTHKGAHLGGFHFGLSSSIIPLLICLEFFNDKRATELLTAYSNYLTEVLEDECWQKYFWGCDFLSGMFGTLSVLTKIFELTYDTRFCKLASALFAKIESILKVRNSKKIIAFERSVTIREDELLSGLSHGVMGCAYSTYYYNSIIAKDNAVESIFLDFLDWEISAYDECIHNWKDYRRRSQSTKGEFSWSHGLPGNYLVLKHLSDNGVKAAKDFVSNNPPAKYFSFETLLKRPRPVNDSLCHGAYGLINIIKKVYPAALNDHRIYIWANLRNLANQDIRELRVRAADPLGLWVGKVGSLLGSIGLLESGFTFPFLPHEMQYIQQ